MTYFLEVIDFLREKSEHLLVEKEWAFINSFEALPEQAQCLFLRMMNRRGVFFRIQKFQYEEIPDLESALALLLKRGFATTLNALHTAELNQILNLFTKAELLSFPETKALAISGVSKLKKEELLRLVLAEIPFESIIQRLQASEPIIGQGFLEETEMLLFLFFGGLDGDMTQFVVRDVGHARYESFKREQLSSSFANRKEAEQKLAFSKAYQYFRELRDTMPPEELFPLLQTWLRETEQHEAIATPIRNRLILKMGRFFEREALPVFAIDTYAFTSEPPSRERRVRLLKQQARLDEARALCLTIQQNPANAEERYFAEDFLNKQLSHKNLKKTTQFLKEAATIFVPLHFKHQVEEGVLAYFEQQGYQGVHAENYLWRSLLGLLLWDVIFDEEEATIHHPFQRAPSDFYQPDFYEKRKAKIKKRVALLKQRDKALKNLAKLTEEKYGIHNPLVGWSEALLPLLTEMLQKVPYKPLKAVMEEMTKNLRENTRGFPDLFIWNEQRYRFVEVKSPTDSLSAQQLFWLEFFDSHGIQAELIHVEWEKEESLK